MINWNGAALKIKKNLFIYENFCKISLKKALK